MLHNDPFSFVPAPLADAMRERGFERLTPIQSAVLERLDEELNLRISSETGSGKTLAVGLSMAPRLLRESRAETGRRGPTGIVIAPTRELAIQICTELRWLFGKVPRIGVESVTGGVDVRDDLRRLRQRPRVLVATPGRLLDHLKRGNVLCDEVEDVVLDEADMLLEMGFREELDAIVAELPSDRRSHLVSATFPPIVRQLAKRFQGEAAHLAGSQLGAPHSAIDTVAHVVPSHALYPALVNSLLFYHGQRALVFVQRRADATELGAKLARDGFSAMPFSGELDQGQRQRTLDAFRRGIVDVLVCTDVAARGLDVPDVGLVIHAALPKDLQTFVHRSGRTGRAGRKGHSLLLVPPRAERRLRDLLREAKVAASWAPIPSPEQVRAAASRRLEDELKKQISSFEATSPPSDAPTNEKCEPPLEAPELASAEKLLEEHDPARLVAALLSMAREDLPREPMGRPAISAPQRRGRASRPERRGRGRERASGNGRYVSFEINWGEHGGATPARIMAHVCRRGGLTSRSVGRLSIGRRSSRFEVAEDRAESFAAKVRVPDGRDPGLRIRRAAGSGHG